MALFLVIVYLLVQLAFAAFGLALGAGAGGLIAAFAYFVAHLLALLFCVWAFVKLGPKRPDRR